MGIFDFFRKDEKSNITTDNGVLGPTYLEGLTEHIQNPKNLHPHEWRRKLVTPSGSSKFRVKYYGERHQEYQNLIVGTADDLPAYVVAVDSLNGQEIVLFDGCKHGYNALFCDSYIDEQIHKRPAINYYRDTQGNDTFEIIISTYYGVNYDDELSDEVDDNGFIKTINGNKVKFEAVKRDGFDALQIWAINAAGKTVEVVSEELA